MIGLLRRYTKTKLVQVIMWLALLSLLVGSGAFISLRKATRGSFDSIGTVNGYAIPRDIFIRKVKEQQHLLSKIKEQLGVDAELFLQKHGYGQKPEERILDSLVNERLWQTGARAVGAHISSAYKLDKIADPAFVMDSLSDYIPQEVLLAPHSVNMAELMRYLQRQGITDEEFEDMVDMSLQRLLYNQLVSGGVYIPQALLKEQYARMFAKKNYLLAILPFDSYLKKVKKDKTSVDNSVLKEFFDNHKQAYQVPEKRSGNLWGFSADKYGMVISDKDLQDYYIKNKRKFIKSPEEVTVQKMVFKLDEKKNAYDTQKNLKKDPGVFEKLAKDRMVIKRGNKDKTREQTAFALAKDGDFSPVIKTKDGYEILKRVSKKAAAFKDLADSKDEITQLLKQEKFIQFFIKDAQRILNQSHSMPTLFTNFIKDKKAEESVVTDLSNDGTTKARMLFGLKGHGRAFYQEDGKGFIIQLQAVKKSYIPELETIKDTVLADYYKHLAQNAIEADLKNIQQKVRAGASLKDAAHEVNKNSKIELTSWLDPLVADSFEELKKHGLTEQKISLLTQPGSVIIEMNPSGYVVQLHEIEPFSEEAFMKKQDTLVGRLRSTEERNVQQTILQALRRDATIDLKGIKTN